MALVTAMIASLLLPASTSRYPIRLEDPQAVYLTKESFSIHADGKGDDSDAIQQAIDQVQAKSGQGIVFIPEGRYRLSKTVTVWAGIRLIGYGDNRPVFTLAPNTPGYQDNEKYMVFFAGRKPNGATTPPVLPEDVGREGGSFSVSNDANPGTFYSAMSNVDIEIAEGNPAAVGVRGTYAQHCYLAHMDFRMKSGLAGVHETGNEATNLRFYGGEYGIITRTPSPGWQFTLFDSYFEGQSKSAIRAKKVGLTMIRPSFSNVPTAVSVDADQTEQLWMKDARLANISGPALIISQEHSLRTQINLEDAVCTNVPVFAHFRESKRNLAAPGETYRVKTMSHGLSYADINAEPKVETQFDAQKLTAWPEPPKTDVFPLPDSRTWVNLASLGAKGDGIFDNTAILKEAIAKHKSIYIPTGKYRVTDSIKLNPDTNLVGLNPITTQIVLTDATPGFGATTDRRSGVPFAGHPKALLETPSGGANIVAGIGLDSGGNNPSTVAALWRAGANSMMDDVKFIGGHGSNVPIYNNNNSGDPDGQRRWDSQYPSLWVTDGGGGTFKGLWTASTFAQSGMLVSNTQTEGRVYQMSSEHHVRYEIQVRNAANWHFIAMQTEQERGESPFALPIEIADSKNIIIANLNMYRVVSVTQPFPYAVKVSNSENIRFRNVHCYSNCKVSFDNVIYDATHDAELRQREFANLTITGQKPKSAKASRKVEKLAGGFFNISGGDVAANGDFVFVDAKWHRIYHWSSASKQVSVLQDSPLFPVNLVVDSKGNVVVVSYAGKGVVYTFSLDQKADAPIRILNAEPASSRAGMNAIYPVTDWILPNEIQGGKPLRRPHHFVAPDGKQFLPASQEFIDGNLTWGVKLQDLIRSFGLAKATPGKPFYMTGESDCRTYVMDVAADGTLSNSRLFAEQGGEGVAVDPAGNVYIAAGHIYVYSPDGKLKEAIRVPERPTQLVFSPDGKTLFITARTSLYAVRI